MLLLKKEMKPEAAQPDIEPLHRLPRLVKDGIDGGIEDVDKPEDVKPAQPKRGK